MSMTRQRGFTLLEVMVAMALTALGLSATYYAIVGSISAGNRLQEKTYAHWIALNQLTEMRLQQQVPEMGETNGDLEYADQRWIWRSRVSETGVENLYRVDVEVSKENSPDDIVSDVVGFIGPPIVGNGRILPWSAEPAEET